MNHLKTIKRIAAVALMLVMGMTSKISAQSCPSSAVITITVNPILEIDSDLNSATPIILCEGGATTLTVVAKGGSSLTPNFKWQYKTTGATTWTDWAGAVTTAGLTSSINPPTSTTGPGAASAAILEYQVIITDLSSTSSCGTATSKTATVEIKPDISIPTDLSAAGQSFVECIGGGRSITVNATGGSTLTGLTFVWEETTTNPATGTPVWTAVQTGLSNVYTPTDNAAAAAIGTRYYRVRVEEPTGNGCGAQTSTTYATVKVTPDLTFSNATLANIVECAGGTDKWTVTTTGGSGGPVTYAWEESSSASGPWAAAPGTNNADTYTPANAPGTTKFYRVSVKDAGTGCDDLVLGTAVSSTVHEKPVVTAVANENSVCKDGSVTFTATIVKPGAPGCNLEWGTVSGGTFTPVSPQPTAPGTTYTTPALSTGAGGVKTTYGYQVRFVCAGSGCCN
jgi:hypothetical protein